MASLDDIFDLQDQVTESVVGAIAPAVEKAEIERARRKPTENLDAYALYLRGSASFISLKTSERRGIASVQQRDRARPEFASAYGRAAYCYVYAKANGCFSDTPNEIAK